jgi:exodeoxyribonuclease VII small subunit
VAVTAKQRAGTSGAEAPGSEASGAGPAADRVPYEQARDELTEVVKRLESGGLTLEQSLDLWERGERLAAICEEWLEGARARLATAVPERRSGHGDPATPF